MPLLGRNDGESVSDWVQRNTNQLFRDGMRGVSPVRWLPHIGYRLNQRIASKMTGLVLADPMRPTLEEFLGWICEPLTLPGPPAGSLANLRRKIQKLVQNPRANQCVGQYHTRDVNFMGFLSICSFLVAVTTPGVPTPGLDLPGLVGAVYVKTRIETWMRQLTVRGRLSAICGCVTPVTPHVCRRNGCVIDEGHEACVPTESQNGFEGISNFTGQKRTTGYTGDDRPGTRYTRRRFPSGRPSNVRWRLAE